jgi:hypothetical protein
MRVRQRLLLRMHDYGSLPVAQAVAYKPSKGHLAERPKTRDYQYLSSGSPAIAGGLNWENDPHLLAAVQLSPAEPVYCRIYRRKSLQRR